jgi:hypothetical protein
VPLAHAGNVDRSEPVRHTTNTTQPVSQAPRSVGVQAWVHQADLIRGPPSTGWTL